MPRLRIPRSVRARGPRRSSPPKARARAPRRRSRSPREDRAQGLPTSARAGGGVGRDPRRCSGRPREVRSVSSSRLESAPAAVRSAARSSRSGAPTRRTTPRQRGSLGARRARAPGHRHGRCDANRRRSHAGRRHGDRLRATCERLRVRPRAIDGGVLVLGSGERAAIHHTSPTHVYCVAATSGLVRAPLLAEVVDEVEGSLKQQVVDASRRAGHPREPIAAK
jgi:hypothetical protein